MTTTTEISTADRLLLAVVAGASPETAAADLGYQGDGADDAVTEVRRRLTLAADQHRDVELAEAISRLDDLFKTARSDGEVRDAIAAQKELNKLRGLDRPAGKVATTGRAERELEAIAGHLRPLKLAPETAGVEELARLAVSEIVASRMRT